jgi:hypothetical protein
MEIKDVVSSDYEKFLNAIGKKIDLEGFEGYSGGLDSRTAKSTLYTKWDDVEIVFHVSHLIASKKGDSQKIEKKRHIGNGNALYK